MSHVGTFGDISFLCQDNGHGGLKARSFHDLSWTSGANFEEHTRPNKKPKLEFIGLTADSLKLTVLLDSSLGYDPWTEYQKFQKVLKSGEVNDFILGGRKFGDYKWALTSLSDAIETTWIDGRMMRMSVDIELKEDQAPSQRNANFGKTVPKNTTPATKKTPKKTGTKTYTVKKGDVLWNIAKKFYGKGADYKKIFNANKGSIKKPNLIYAGQTFTIPA